MANSPVWLILRCHTNEEAENTSFLHYKEQRKLSELLSELNQCVLYSFYSAFAKVAAIPCCLKCVCVCV